MDGFKTFAIAEALQNNVRHTQGFGSAEITIQAVLHNLLNI
jgi:hypothetical protein